jgi:Lrp/AsnC family transcriptional regulator for asnA, asnC and gidA
MNKLDLKILQIMVNDSMIPFSELAKNLSVSTDTVIRHYKKMKESGLIKRSTIVIDLSICGFIAYIGYFVELYAKANPIDMEAEINKIPNCTMIIKSCAPFNLYAEFFVRDFDEVTEITRTISMNKGVKKATFIFYPRVPPNEYEHPIKQMYQGQVACIKEIVRDSSPPFF